MSPALQAKLRLGWKWPTMKNTLAYYRTELIMALKGFIIEASWNFFKGSN
jgi:hypothetical protein